VSSRYQSQNQRAPPHLWKWRAAAIISLERAHAHSADFHWAKSQVAAAYYRSPFDAWKKPVWVLSHSRRALLLVILHALIQPPPIIKSARVALKEIQLHVRDWRKTHSAVADSLISSTKVINNVGSAVRIVHRAAIEFTVSVAWKCVQFYGHSPLVHTLKRHGLLTLNQIQLGVQSYKLKWKLN
jgi:hypothetical protein